MLPPPPPAQMVTPPGYQVMQRIDLSGPLHLGPPWTAVITAPIGPDAATGSKPVRVCFTGGPEGSTHCEPISVRGYGFQSFVEAKLETLSAKTGLRGLVVRAAYSAGGDGLKASTVWVCEKRVCLETFETDTTDLGEEKRFAAGPLDGDDVTADFVTTRENETRWGDPHRFSIDVYRLDPHYGGYLKVLQYVTARDYPAERQTAHEVIDAETTTIVKLLRLVYPAGPPP